MNKPLVFVSCQSNSRGKWSDWSNTAHVPPFSAGLQFGISVFEGMQAHVFSGGREFRIQFLADHHERLSQSASLFGIDVPDIATFEAGLKLAATQVTCDQGTSADSQRIYLRTLHFSGCEDIFPRSSHPFFCNIFARFVPMPRGPAPISILADRPYVRAALGSSMGASKCATNYAQLVELDRISAVPPSVQRLWVSPKSGHAIEELDTMAIGLIMNDGTYRVPPPSTSKLPSITMKKLIQRLAENGHSTEPLTLDVDTLAEHLRSGIVSGIFAASTGRGLGLATEIQIGKQLHKLTPASEHVDALWRAYTEMHEPRSI